MITIERLARVAMEDMAIRDVIYYSDDLKSEGWTEDGTWEEEEDYFLNREDVFSQGNYEDDYEEDYDDGPSGTSSGRQTNAGAFKVYGKYDSGDYEEPYETDFGNAADFGPGSDFGPEVDFGSESDFDYEEPGYEEPGYEEPEADISQPDTDYATDDFTVEEPEQDIETLTGEPIEESFAEPEADMASPEADYTAAFTMEEPKSDIEALTKEPLEESVAEPRVSPAPLTTEDMENLKKERAELEALYIKFEDEKKQFRQEMKKLNQRASDERKRLKEEESFFDKKMDILKGGFAQLEADRTALEREKICWERERLDLEKRKDAALREDSMRIFFVGVNNPITLKKRYKDLIKIFHPDNVGGDTGILQKINKLYDSMWAEMGWQKKA